MKSWRDNSRSIAAILSAVTMLGMTSVFAQTVTPCQRLISKDDINPTLATLEAKVASTSIRRGDPLRVTLTLVAGPRGISLPDYFGGFMQTCTLGFYATLLTPEGRNANPDPVGCGRAGGTLTLHYAGLSPGDTRAWSTTLPTESIPPGHYCLQAAYDNFTSSGDMVLDPPADSTLEGHGRITANPIAVEIR